MPWRLLKRRLKLTSYPNMTASGETYFRTTKPGKEFMEESFLQAHSAKGAFGG